MRFRLFLAGEVVRDEIVEVTSGEQLAALSQQHSSYLLQAAAEQDTVWMVEAEVLNDPTDPERFMRFGTDPSRMNEPLPLDGEPRHPWAR